MTLHTPLCDMLGIEHPILLAGMGGVSFAEVCAAVSNAGGFGTLGMAGQRPETIRDQMRQVRDLTDKPFGVDLLAAVPDALEKSVDIIIAEGARCFIAGLGVPSGIIGRLHAAGVLVFSMCGTVAHAVKAEAAGCDAVVAQGTEAGGHTGLVAGMALIPQVVDAVRIPVVAAGSIVDGRGLAAALAFGAQGVWVGTRFIASREAHAGPVYKQAIVEAAETDTLVSRCYSGKPMRVRRNPYVEEWERRPNDMQKFPFQAQVSVAAGVMGGIGGKLEGLDPARDCLPMGQGAGAIHDVLPCAQIVERMMSEAQATIGRLAHLSRSA